MEIFGDIRELLQHIDENIKIVEEGYAKARLDDEQETLSKPLIKGILSDLRSVLDYSAVAVYKTYSRKDGKIYFPYSDDEQSYASKFKSNLNGLDQQRPEVYALIKSIQPFATGRNWLSVLCSLTNETKHNSLGKQRRNNSDSAHLSVGNLFKAEAGGTFILNGVLVDGVPVGVESPFEISHRTKKKELERVLGHVGKIEKEFDWVKFEYIGTSTDILALLKESRTEVGSFVEKLEGII